MSASDESGPEGPPRARRQEAERLARKRGGNDATDSKLRVPRATRAPLDPKVRAHLLTTAFLALGVLAIALLLTRPVVLLWILAAVAAVMLYAALHLAITRRLVEDDAHEPHEPG